MAETLNENPYLGQIHGMDDYTGKRCRRSSTNEGLESLSKRVWRFCFRYSCHRLLFVRNGEKEETEEERYLKKVNK
jgi:hypothetical protein